MNRSGGLLWHDRAWRRQGAWRGTCNHIRQWLEQTQPNSRELVIIGASAGWMMPSPWLQGFEKVTTLDIDRWAAPLFRWRHGPALKRSGTQLRCDTGDAIGDLSSLLAAHPDAAVLFDNVFPEGGTAADAERLFRRFSALATLRPMSEEGLVWLGRIGFFMFTTIVMYLYGRRKGVFNFD
jgi:hypothetical protein